MHILACAPAPVRKVRYLLPDKWIEQLEENQKIASCCRHPEEHTIEAWYSCEEEKAKGVPDIYINTCTCGRKHRRLCGGSGTRPTWDIR